jgi:hypothetical protein
MPADEKGAVAVPREVYVGIVAVRDSGLTNMLDRPRVAEIAAEMDHAEAADWIRANKKLYAEGVFRGFAPEGGEAKPPRVAKGSVARYVGDLHPGLRGRKVRVVGPIRCGWWEIAPWIEQEGRWSWVTSDARPEDLAPIEEEDQ